jgi:hypothetical protein
MLLHRHRPFTLSGFHFSKMSSLQSQPRPQTLNFITGNANKLSEVRAILADVQGLQVQSRDVPGLDEIQGTIAEVARDKCSKAAAVVSSFFLSLGLVTGISRESQRPRSNRRKAYPRLRWVWPIGSVPLLTMVF